MAEDRAHDPARRPNLGLPNFVQNKLNSKPKVNITKRTDLGVAGREDMEEETDKIKLAKSMLNGETNLDWGHEF